MRFPSVSITVPAYNAETTVPEMIESVLAQTYPDYELIICDDASISDTAKVVESYADSRIRLIRSERNQGEGPARDRAIAVAHGDWFALLDADDAWRPERLKTLMEAASKHPGSMVFDEIMECHDTPDGMVPWHPVRGSGAFDGGQGVRQIRFPDFIRSSRTLIKPLIPMSAIRDGNIRHSAKKFSADLEFFLELAAHGLDLCYVPEPMYLYRVAAGSMSSSPERYRLLRETLEESLPKFADDPESVEAIRDKIRQVRRNEEYQPFFSAIMSGNLARAARIACGKPWVVPEFCGRSMERIPYHFHRLLHRGSRRATA